MSFPSLRGRRENEENHRQRDTTFITTPVTLGPSKPTSGVPGFSHSGPLVDVSETTSGDKTRTRVGTGENVKTKVEQKEEIPYRRKPHNDDGII